MFSDLYILGRFCLCVCLSVTFFLNFWEVQKFIREVQKLFWQVGKLFLQVGKLFLQVRKLFLQVWPPPDNPIQSERAKRSNS